MTLISIDREDATLVVKRLLQKTARLVTAVRDGDVGKSLLNATDIELAAQEMANLIEAGQS